MSKETRLQLVPNRNLISVNKIPGLENIHLTSDYCGIKSMMTADTFNFKMTLT